MLIRYFGKNVCWKIRRRFYHKRNFSATAGSDKTDLERIRNIGIMAHIDAGKTTTTERMLFYSGSIPNMGEVHDGNTVTDFMEQERQRGITIASAAVTFAWKGHRLNLIDTPGHIDFTMGVEQTLGALDGAVVILDSSAGVEAQTTTVWRQADRYSLPRIVYCNKMDRADADFDMCLTSIETKFDVTPLPVQIPLKNNSELSIVDLLTLETVTFDRSNQGRKVQRQKLEDPEALSLARERRRSLTDKLSELDDNLADKIIEQESLDDIPGELLLESLRRTTLAQRGVPVLLGSSYKNVGVQLLMDAAVFYLPSPNHHQKAKLYSCFRESFAARAFKVIHDKQRGPITFFRVFTGKLSKGQRVYNVQREKTEQGGKLYAAYADDYEEIAEVSEGNIAALGGLKSTITGDLLTGSVTAVARAKEILQRRDVEEADRRGLFDPARVPDPVFFCSIEPPSMAYQSALDTALQELEREDPSLRVSVDSETGQTVLSGMGELHIEIIKERIRTEYKIHADLGPLQIAYKETIGRRIKDSFELHHVVGSTKHDVTVTMSLIDCYEGEELLLMDNTRESASNLAAVHPRFMGAVKSGVSSALNCGPRLGCPVIKVGVKLHWLEVGKGTSETMVASAVSQCIRKLLEDAGVVLLEPIMRLEIVTPEAYAPGVLGDLGRRRTEIQEITVRRDDKIIRSLAPLSELLGYATKLRILTSGTGNFSLEFDSYKRMGPLEEQQAIKNVTGF
ncbi:ribosome-releasing factor 2, mitochondrial [Diachasma alloeum]|uniref:ribosome-releasing factor 2, mitochondrial n=1 Tax=Diachasma alloeum TaxID=454923 RepID=UPI0007383A4E|nr:ribosome-releasing factor 2, mitochondrial [Diachasma alloeum]